MKKAKCKRDSKHEEADFSIVTSTEASTSAESSTRELAANNDFVCVSESASRRHTMTQSASCSNFRSANEKDEHVVDGETAGTSGGRPTEVAAGLQAHIPPNIKPLGWRGILIHRLLAGPRNIVSQKRRRHRDPENRIDLDLTYITDRIIAMGYPASNVEFYFRNAMSECKRYLNGVHQDHYRVYNLRGQYAYDERNFGGRVMSFEMTDHHPPRLELMAPFCRDVYQWLSQDERNVIVVHCKAGKGRTGVMICAFLCYIQFYKFPRQILDYYSILRTINNKGVTIPSQRRYIYYFNHLRQNRLNYMPTVVQLIGVFVERPPEPPLKREVYLQLHVKNGEITVFNGGLNRIKMTPASWAEEEKEWRIPGGSTGRTQFYRANHRAEGEEIGPNELVSKRVIGWQINPNEPVFLEGDVRLDLTFAQPGKISDNVKKIGHVWFNTMFVCRESCTTDGNAGFQHGDLVDPYPERRATGPWDTPIGSYQRRGEQQEAEDLDHSGPSSSRGPDGSVPSGQHAQAQAGASKRKTSWMGGMIKKFTPRSKQSTSSRDSHQQEIPLIDSNETVQLPSDAPGQSRECYPPSEEDLENFARDYDLSITRPPGLDAHCPESSANAIWGEHWKRKELNGYLETAHRQGIVCDHYHDRQRRIAQRIGTPLVPSPGFVRNEQQNFGTIPEKPNEPCQPMELWSRSDEHVLEFGVQEIDRAVKNPRVHDGLKIYVVLRCLDQNENNEKDNRNTLARAFIDLARKKQLEKDDKKNQDTRAKAGRRSSDAARDERHPSIIGALPDDGSTCDDYMQNDPRAQFPPDSDEARHYNKFLYRQRCNSESRYPEPTYRCPLLANAGSSLHSSAPAEPLPSHGPCTSGTTATATTAAAQQLSTISEEESQSRRTSSASTFAHPTTSSAMFVLPPPMVPESSAEVIVHHHAGIAEEQKTRVPTTDSGGSSSGGAESSSSSTAPLSVLDRRPPFSDDSATNLVSRYFPTGVEGGTPQASEDEEDESVDNSQGGSKSSMDCLDYSSA